VDEIAADKLKKIYLKMGITIDSSYYVHGEFDWILLFTAQDLKKEFHRSIANKVSGDRW
jgi:uncharacterized protein with GYD domain